MRDLMKQVVNRLYTFQLLAGDPGFPELDGPLGDGRPEMGRAGSGRGFSEGGRSFLNRLDTRLPDELLRSVRNRPALVALCALLSLTVSSYAIAGE